MDKSFKINPICVLGLGCRRLDTIVLKLKPSDQKVAVIEGKYGVDEHQFKSFGEVSALKPGADESLKAKLTP